MSRRAVMSVLGAAALLAASVAGASSAAALVSGATAPASQSFGSTPVYSAVERTITVTASGEAVTFGGIPTIEPVGGALDQADDYSVVGRTCMDTVAAGATCTVTVEFRPFSAGLRQATLNIATTTPAANVLVALSGTGVPDSTGTYYGLATPTRFFDSRPGSMLAAGSTTSVQITTRAGIPATGVSAVVLNLTAVGTTAKGYFTVYPSDKARPTSSSINFPKGWVGANMVTVPVGADGMIKLYNFGGATDAIIDVQGWYAKDDTVRATKGMGAQFLSTGTGDPVRIYDSRQDPVNFNEPFKSLDYIEFADTWSSAAAATAVKAYAVTITAVNALSPGVFTAWAGGFVGKPTASAVNYQKGVQAPNMAIVPAGHYDPAHPEYYQPDQTGFRIQNVGGTVHLLVDITGYYVADDSAGMRFKPLASAPKRILDTGKSIGLSGSFGPNQARTAEATSIASSDSIYVVGNTTGDLPTATTYLTIWSGENARPATSNLNVNQGLTRAVSTYAPLAYDNATGKLSYTIYNHSGTMRVIFDAAGTLDLYPGQALLPAATLAAGTAATDSRTADRTLAGRTIPGASTFSAGHEGTTHRRG